MQLTVKGKQLDVGDALRTHVADSLTTVVGKYFNKPIEANVVLAKDAHLYKADIQVHVGRGIVLQSAADATEPYPAFDTACDKLAKRLRRYKSRLRDHHGENGSAAVEALPARYQILEAEADDHEAEAPVDGAHQPMVVAEMETSIATLSVSEAVMRLELAQAPALMFHNGVHGRLNMVYRRADGNIGWVDPAEKAGA
ncbi:ribosome hibernation-promoting factor, HPF/YfiA family [Azospirillum agricola]|uniref:ribosome hibernation-promoting factor, HPF/YfiA family n=1 Tax=Azospirillum agricola TaxID=1720247 RepID=UPI000A0F0DC6|nr:ribosome-associated translation inhibitor RaiA [Azospirillum agricola]MBP2228334.1 ribosomal subunit interface protein [Azospirillum agricola]SMH54867.1 SSU ribosomal protein S30P /sigma 54 modulation protein [Azospirillum lipoferum]